MTHVLTLDVGTVPSARLWQSAKKRQNVYMVDKDFVAIEYARKNVKQNQLQNCHVLLSNGFSHLPEVQFDVIASNLPANVGKELLQTFFTEAKRHLKQDGRLYVVTISGLREFIKRNFKEVFGNYLKVKQRNTHTVANGNFYLIE